MSQARTDKQKRRDALQRILQTWRTQALVRQDWTLEWDAEISQWRVAFNMAGRTGTHHMTEEEFKLYHLGFTDRPRAIRYRPPQITIIPGQTLPGQKRKKNRV